MKDKNGKGFAISFFIFGALWLIIAGIRLASNDVVFGLLSGLLGCGYLVRGIYEIRKEKTTDTEKE